MVSAPTGHYTKLMVVAGHPTDAKAEIVDLSGDDATCPDVADYPYAYGTLGTYIGDRAMVCGGWDVFRQMDECYTYNNLVRAGKMSAASLIGVTSEL